MSLALALDGSLVPPKEPEFTTISLFDSIKAPIKLMPALPLIAKM